MATAIKHIVAGPFHLRVLGQVPEKGAAPKRRGARANPTPPAQAFYNDKRSWMELRLWIAANFGGKSYVLNLHTPVNFPTNGCGQVNFNGWNQGCGQGCGSCC